MASIYTTISLNAATGGGKRATNYLQQCRFTAADPSDDADSFPFFVFKGNFIKRPKFPILLFGYFANRSLKA